MNITQSDNQLETILNQLVSIPSVTGNQTAASKVIARTAQLLQRANISQTSGEINGYPYLLASTREPDNETLWFVNHLDVVPASASMFRVTSDDKNYYGRGVFDMKGMAAATLAAFLKLPSPKKANVGFLFTTDEEVGGKNGVAALVNSNFKAGAAFVFDQSADWVLQEKMKGVLWLEVTATGKAAHGARPWLGHSANLEAIKYLHKFEKWHAQSIPKNITDNYYTTLNIGTLHGGEATNQVNDTTKATIDIRFVSDAEAAKVIEAAESIANDFTGVNVKVLMREPCVDTDTAEKWYKTTAQLMKTLKIKPGPNGERFGHGSTDGRFFAPFGIPVITTRPPGGGQHGPKEWVSKKGLHDLERLCFELFQATRH